MADINSILAVAENPEHARTVVAKLLLRQDLEARHADLEAKIDEAARQDRMLNREEVAPQIAAELAELEDLIESEMVEFTFRSIGKRPYADLLAKHPPSKAQRQAGSNANVDTLAAPLIAASCVDPVMSDDEVVRLELALNNSQFDLLFASAVDANIGGLEAPKSLAAGIYRQAKSG